MFYFVFYITGFVLRVVFVWRTPDIIYAPSLIDSKFSTEPVKVLQNSNISFVPCDADCLKPNTDHKIFSGTKSREKLAEYYSTLYRIDNGPNFELRAFNSPRAFWDTEGTFFFVYPPLSALTAKDGVTEDVYNVDEWLI